MLAPASIAAGENWPEERRRGVDGTIARAARRRRSVFITAVSRRDPAAPTNSEKFTGISS